MKEIKLPVMGTIKPTPGSPVCVGEAMKNHKIARANGSKVIQSSLLIERNLEDIISIYFFDDNKDKTRFFESIVLSSDWFSFSAKRKIVISIINKTNRLQGREKENIEKLLKKIISYRNAFTHGDIVEKSNGTFLEYFEGSLQEKELNDNYWDELENVFKDTITATNELLKKAG